MEKRIGSRRARILGLALLLIAASITLQSCTLLEIFARAAAAACEQPAFNVTHFEDTNDGLCTTEDCSLREAVITANACAGPDVINLAPGTYSISLAGRSSYPAEYGALEVTDALTINGNSAEVAGRPGLRISGRGTEVSISELTVGPVFNEGVTALNDVVAARITNIGQMTATDVDVLDGDGIRNTGTFTLTGGNILNNAPEERLTLRTRGRTVRIVDNDGGEMTLTDVVVANNTMEAEFEGEFVPVTGIGNTAGFLELNNVEIRDNNPPAARDGRGLIMGGGSTRTVLNGVTISGHTGFGILNWSGELEVTESEIFDNAGGAMLASTETSTAVRRSTIARNGGDDRRGFGCGVIQHGGNGLLIENSTLSGNTEAGEGCALLLNLSSVQVLHTTIYDNGLPAIHNLTRGSPDVEIERSLLANNAGGNCVNPGTVSLGLNLFDDGSCPVDGAAGDLLESGGALGILPLADNGGPTRTHALDDASPAVDAAGPSCVATDQRGISRPQGAACDIGAYELEAEGMDAAGEAATSTPSPAPTATKSALPSVATDTLCWKGPGPGYEVVSSLEAGVEVALLGRGERRGWWVVDNPRYPGVACWVEEDALIVDPTPDPLEVEIFPVPPLPTVTPSEEPEIEGCLYQGPNDSEPVCYPIANCPVPFEQTDGACEP